MGMWPQGFVGIGMAEKVNQCGIQQGEYNILKTGKYGKFRPLEYTLQNYFRY